MPVMTCQLCRAPNQYCQPRVCGACRTQYYRCHACSDRNCPCGQDRWLLLSECHEQGIRPRAPGLLDMRQRGTQRKPAVSAEAQPQRQPRDELKLKRRHSALAVPSMQTEGDDDVEEDDEPEDPPRRDGDDDGDDGGDTSARALVAQTVIGANGKMPLAQFLAEVDLLTEGIAHICPEGGMTRERWEERYRQLEAQRQKVLAMLGGPSCIRGVASRGGIAGLIEELDPRLLHASDVLRRLRAELDRIDREGPLQLGPLKPTLECERRARAGETLIRYWKIYRSYAAIWGGAKWKTAGLQDEVGEGHPVKLLSQRNIERLKAELRRERNSRLEPGTILRLQRRKLRAEGRYLDIGDEIGTLKETLHAMNSDPDEEPDPDRVEEIEDEIADLLAEREEMDLKASALERRLARLSEGLGLEEDEHELFIELLKLPFKLKHATNAWYCIANDGRLDSFTEIRRKHPDWQSEFSTNGNIQALGNGGFVFFRLDVGCGDIKTRYGATLVTCDMELLARHGWVSMYDQLKPLSSDTMKRTCDGIGQLVRTAEMCGAGGTGIKYCYGCAPRQRVRVKTKDPNAPAKYRTADAKEFGEVWFEREVSFIDLVFHGPQIHLGIALAVILELRFLRRCGYRAAVLRKLHRCSADGGSADGQQLSPRQAYLAGLLSGLFRPEAKYPVALRLSHTPPQLLHKPEGDARYRDDGTENPEVMRAVKLEQRRKELEAKLHVTRQQWGGATKRGKTAREKQHAAAQEGEAAKAARFKADAERNEESAAAWLAKTQVLETELEDVKRQQRQ